MIHSLLRLIRLDIELVFVLIINNKTVKGSQLWELLVTKILLKSYAKIETFDKNIHGKEALHDRAPCLKEENQC